MIGNSELNVMKRIIRDNDFEIRRQRVIKKGLGCKFIRFSLDDPEFEVFKVINKIHHHYKRTERKM